MKLLFFCREQSFVCCKANISRKLEKVKEIRK